MLGIILAAAAFAIPHGAIDAVAARCGADFGSAANRKASSVHQPVPSVVCFNGPIDASSGAHLASTIKTLGKSGPAYLVVNSSGGDAAIGLELGARVAERDVTIIVDGACASSCANYLFLGARRRTILAGSLLIFHGGFGPQALAQLRPAIEALKQEQPSLDVDSAVAAEARKIRAGMVRQDSFLTRVHVRPEVFSLFDEWEAGRIVPAADCRSNPDAAGVVFSPAALASPGIEVMESRGVATAGDLRTALHAINRDGALCFWADPVP